MMNKVFIGLIVAMVVLIFPLHCMGGEEDRTGFFTNLWFHDEAGDLLGFELYIAKTSDGYVGALYESVGGGGPVIAIEPVFDGDIIQFEYESNNQGDSLFRGTVDPCGITGDFYLRGGDFESEPTIRLKRKQSYWN